MELEKKSETNLEKKTETPETGIESSGKVSTFEDLERIGKEKMADGKAVSSGMETDGRMGIDNGNQTIKLSSQEKKEEINNRVEENIERIGKSASEAFDELSKELEGMLIEKIANKKGSREEIDQKLKRLEELGEESREEGRIKHEEEMKKIQEEHEEKIRQMKSEEEESNRRIASAQEAQEKAMFGGRTQEEAEDYIEKTKKEMEQKALDSIKTAKKAGGKTEEEWREELKKKDEEMKALHQQQLSELKKSSDESIERARKKAADTIREMQEGMGLKQEGEKVKVKVCPKCGVESEISANFCGSCGSKLESSKAEVAESSAEKIKKAQNFPELFQALRERGSVKNPFNADAKMIDPEMAIEVIKGQFNRDPRKVVEEIKQGKLLSFLSGDGVNDKVSEIFQRAI
ncbi:MAG: hypothetical protein WC906_04275 [Parcubacteria group bacterium]|jgi:ribosomal protein L40E